MYGNSNPTQHSRVLAIDVSDDWIWRCVDSYDISPQYGEYSAISYDRESDKIWVAHGQQRRIVSYDFGDNGQFTRERNSIHSLQVHHLAPSVARPPAMCTVLWSILASSTCGA